MPSPSAGSPPARPHLSRRELGAALALPLALPLVPADAWAAGDATRTWELPLRGDTGVLERPAFGLVAATWGGRDRAPSVRARVRRAGRWTGWHSLGAPDADGLANARATRAGTRPWWIGSADAVEARVHGAPPRDLRLVLVQPGPDSDALTWGAHVQHALAPAGPVQPPPLVTRAQWRADERAAWWKPEYTRTVDTVIVHHTDSTNSYSQRSGAAQVRSIFAYHARSLDWGDIGYSFLIDRYGTVYEGRKGGAGEPVVAGHTYGFNHATIGIALIGTFSGTKPTPAMQSSLTKLITWVLARYHRDPYGREVLTVDERHVNPRHPRKGSKVVAPVIGAHRDFYPTDCCGSRAYALLPGTRKLVAARLGARLVDPSLAVVGTTASLRARPVGVAAASGHAVTSSGAPLATVPVALDSSATSSWSFANVPAGTSALFVTPASASGVAGVPVEVDIAVTGGVGPRVVLPTGSFAVTADGTVWLIDDLAGAAGAQERRLVAAYALSTFPNASSRLIPGADDSVLALPLGGPALPRDGSLLRAQTAGFFVMSGGRCCPLGFATLLALGYDATSAVAVADSDIATLPPGPAIVGGGPHPAGSYVRDGGVVYAIVASSSGALSRRAVVSTTAVTTLVPANAVLNANNDDRALPLDTWRRGLADGVVWRAGDGSIGIVSRGISRPVTPTGQAGLQLPAPIDATAADLGNDGTAPTVGVIVDQRVAPASAVVTMLGDRLQHRASWIQQGYGNPDAPGPAFDPARP